MKTIVIKIGSGTLLTKRGRIDEYRIAHVAEQVRTLKQKGFGVILVISGAVASGMRYVQGTEDLHRRVAAGIGQVAMITTLQRNFAAKDITVAQVLLTAASLKNAQRASIRRLLKVYLESGIVTVVNENDAVHLNGFGGNDLLSMLIAQLVHAEQVLILSQMVRSVRGVGGGESKLHAVRELNESGIHACIVNGKDKNSILTNVLK